MKEFIFGLLALTGLLAFFSRKKENFQGDLKYLEIQRGNMPLYNYPPCYQRSNDAKAIFDYLKEAEITKGSTNLINCISMILCQRIYTEEKDCSLTMLKDRLTNLADMGFRNVYTNEYIKYNSMVNTFLSTEQRLKMSQSAKIFLTGCTMLIQQNVEELSKLIPIKEYEDLQSVINNIYKKNYPIIAGSC